MSEGLALDSRQLALALRQLLRDLDPARFREGLHAAALDRISEMEARLSALADAARAKQQDLELTERLREVAELLRERVPTAPTRVVWMAFRLQLQDAYDSLCGSLQTWKIHLPPNRPTNYARNVFHIASGVALLLLLELVLTPTSMIVVAASFAVLFWGLELGRRFVPRLNDLLMGVATSISHPHERHRVNSGTWYSTAMVGLALLFSPVECAIAVIVLGVADPAAAIVGRRYGTTPLVNGRSLQGSVAFLLVGTAVAFTSLAVFHAAIAWPAALAVAASAALAGTVAELFSRRIDDNLSIPLAAASGAWIVLTLI